MRVCLKAERTNECALARNERAGGKQVADTWLAMPSQNPNNWRI